VMIFLDTSEEEAAEYMHLPMGSCKMLFLREDGGICIGVDFPDLCVRFGVRVLLLLDDDDSTGTGVAMGSERVRLDCLAEFELFSLMKEGGLASMVLSDVSSSSML